MLPVQSKTQVRSHSELVNTRCNINQHNKWCKMLPATKAPQVCQLFRGFTGGCNGSLDQFVKVSIFGTDFCIWLYMYGKRLWVMTLHQDYGKRKHSNQRHKDEHKFTSHASAFKETMRCMWVVWVDQDVPRQRTELFLTTSKSHLSRTSPGPDCHLCQ